jgi:hypothetical protein
MNIGTWFITDAQGNVVINTSQSFDLGATGLNEVLQNVRVITTTRIRQVQLDRRLGMAFNFVDAPMNIAQKMIITDVCYALTHQEPRAKFKSIQFAPSKAQPGRMDVRLSVNIDTSELTHPVSQSPGQ